MIFQVTKFACILVSPCEIINLLFLIWSPSTYFSGIGVTLSDGKQPSIGNGRKVISGIDTSNDSDQVFIGSASTAGGSLRNVVEGEKITFFICYCSNQLTVRYFIFLTYNGCIQIIIIYRSCDFSRRQAETSANI